MDVDVDPVLEGEREADGVVVDGLLAFVVVAAAKQQKGGLVSTAGDRWLFFNLAHKHLIDTNVLSGPGVTNTTQVGHQGPRDFNFNHPC